MFVLRFQIDCKRNTDSIAIVYEEEGVDAGGVTREWYSTLARSIFNPNYALFQPSSSDQLVYQPNPHSYVNVSVLVRIICYGVITDKLLLA